MPAICFNTRVSQSLRVRLPLCLSLLLAAVMLFSERVNSAESTPPFRVFEQAEYVVSESRRPPPDSALWQAISLPDNWHVRDPEFRGTVWYRIRFDSITRNNVHALYLPRMSSANIQFVVNGLPFGTTNFRTNPSLTELQQGSIRPIPSHFIKPTDNVMHVRVTGDATYRHGLTRILMGAGSEIIPRFRLRDDLQRTAPVALGAMLLVLGIIAGAIWRMDSRDPVLFWFCVASITTSMWILQMVWPPEIEIPPLHNLALFAGNFFFVTPILILCRRVAGKLWELPELLLWLPFLAGCLVALLAGQAAYPSMNTTASIISLALLTGSTSWVTSVWWHDRRWHALLLLLGVIILVVLTGHDLARWVGYVDYDNMLAAPFATPFLILALGIVILSRHIEVARALAEHNALLGQKVQAKVREAEEANRKVQEMLRDQAVLRERQRLMADMHDGLGSNLVALLGAARSGKTTREDLVAQLDETARDLYAIVDSLQPVEGDLGVVLGNIRYRMQKAIEAAGIELSWDISELPAIEGLTPEIVLSIHRMLLEVISNSIRHSGAHTITACARANPADGSVQVEIADNGRGFDPDSQQQGRGLSNIRFRAERAGIQLDIRSKPGEGTRTTLTLPAVLGTAH